MDHPGKVVADNWLRKGKLWLLDLGFRVVFFWGGGIVAVVFSKYNFQRFLN